MAERKLLTWKNTDYLAYILSKVPSYKKEKWSKYNEAWNKYNALVIMHNNKELSAAFSALVGTDLFKAIVLADDNSLATAAAQYGFPSTGGPRLPLEIAIAVYQKDTITADDIALVGRFNSEYADVLRHIE